MCDVQTVAMITDRPAAVKSVVMKVTGCTNRARLIYFVDVIYISVITVVVVRNACYNYFKS